MMMMMMMMMMMRRPSSLRVRAEPRHLPYIYIYIYIYVSKTTINHPSVITIFIVGMVSIPKLVVYGIALPPLNSCLLSCKFPVHRGDQLEIWDFVLGLG